MGNISHILYLSFVVSIIWFLAAGVLYKNPWVDKIYKKYSVHPGMKKWDSMEKYLSLTYFLAVLIPCIIFSFVYDFIGPLSILNFGLVLSGVRIIPRMADMWMQSSYPNTLLWIEVINGTILCFVGAAGFVLL